MLTDEQKALRLDYITGSDAAIICGASKWCTPYQLWEYKTKRAVAPDISSKPHVKAGIMLEGAIREWLSEEIGKVIVPSTGMAFHGKAFWMAGNVDGYVMGESAIVEVKTASSDEGWGPNGSNIIPRHYLLQVAHYMAVTNTAKCYVAVLIRGVDFRYYVIDRDLELEGDLIEKEGAFWECVTHDTPPDAINTDDLVRMYSRSDAFITKPTNDSINEQLQLYRANKAVLDNCGELDTRLKNVICSYMQDAKALVNPDGVIVATWNTVKGRSGIDLDLLKEKYPDVYKAVTKIGNPTRRFNVI